MRHIRKWDKREIIGLLVTFVPILIIVYLLIVAATGGQWLEAGIMLAISTTLAWITLRWMNFTYNWFYRKDQKP